MFSLEELKKAKKQKKMTLQQIADLTNIPKRTVDNIFSGQTKYPRFDTLEAIQKVLGIPTGENQLEGVSDFLTVTMSYAEYELFDKIRQLDDLEKLAIGSLIEKFLRAKK